MAHKNIYIFSGWAVGLVKKWNVGDRNGHQIWSPVSSTAFVGVVVCATKEFGWIICSRSIYFILGHLLLHVFSCLTQKNIYFLRMGGWPSLKTERRRQKWTSDMESGIIYCFWRCSCLCHKRIWMDYLFQIGIFHPGSTTIQYLIVVLHKKNIYFLRMGGWPSLKTERRRQKWTSDMESGIIYC